MSVSKLKATLLLVLTCGLASACSGVDDQFAAVSTSGHQVRLVQQPWTDLVVENEIASQLLGRLGYSPSIDELSVPLGAQALATGQADAYLGNWWPSQKPVFEPHLDDGRVDVAGTLMTGTQYALAVPERVRSEYGIDSLADLDAQADAFGHRILGIEPGSPGNQIINDAIKNDVYGLGDWQLVQSSAEAMLAEVSRLQKTGRPVVFLGWSPHWMTVQWKLHFLDDPEHFWPGAGEIRVLTRPGLADDDPNLYRFLSQMKVDNEVAAKWIYQHDKQGIKVEDIATRWIREHPDEIRAWLEGVQSIDGDPAASVIYDDKE